MNLPKIIFNPSVLKVRIQALELAVSAIRTPMPKPELITQMAEVFERHLLREEDSS